MRCVARGEHSRVALHIVSFGLYARFDQAHGDSLKAAGVGFKRAERNVPAGCVESVNFE